MIFYSLSRTGTAPARTLVRAHATTDAEADATKSQTNPQPPSVFVPAAYHEEVPQELVISSELEMDLCEDLRVLGRVRFQRNFAPSHYLPLVARVRFRFPLADNPLLRHHARVLLRGTPIAFFPELGLRDLERRDTPLPPGKDGELYDPATGEVY